MHIQNLPLMPHFGSSPLVKRCFPNRLFMAMLNHISYSYWVGRARASTILIGSSLYQQRDDNLAIVENLLLVSIHELNAFQN